MVASRRETKRSGAHPPFPLIGQVSHIQFKAALRGTGIMLQDRDLRKLTAGYSINRTKMVDYRNFLADAFRGLGGSAFFGAKNFLTTKSFWTKKM